MDSGQPTATSTQSDNFIILKPISDEKKEETQGHAFPSVGRTNTMSSTDEGDITQDDLAAMKAMIGDIKKDPSLLYKLSNLGAAEGPSTFGMGDLGGDVAGDNNTSSNNYTGMNNTFLHSNVLAANNAMRNSILVDDDHTEVSSLGMMSYEESGRSLLNSSQQFSPPGKNQGNIPARESFASRTNKDVEIALRMQSLRAKKGLFNSPHASGGTLLRSSSARQLGGIPQSQLSRSVSAPRGQEINSKVDKLDVDNKILYSKQPSPTAHTNRARSHTSPSVPINEQYATTRETNELRESSLSAKPETSEPIAMADRSINYKPDESSEQQENSDPSTIANIKFHRYKPDDSGEIGVEAIRKASASMQRSLITPDLQQNQAKFASTSLNNQAMAHTRKRDADVSDQKPPNDDDDDSQTSALVLYNNSLDKTPHDEHRKQFRESLDTQRNEHALPFRRKDSDNGMIDNAYLNAVSKYTTTRVVERDSDKNQLRRSSSSRSSSSRRSSLQQKENERRVSVSDETTRIKHSNNVPKSRRATSELRQAEKQTAEYKRERKVRKQKKRAESSRRRRSSSEDPRATKDGLPWPPPPPPRDDVKHVRPARQFRRPSLDENALKTPSSSQRSTLEREPNDVMPSPSNTHTSMNNRRRDGEIVDTLSSLNSLLHTRSSDSIAVMEVGLGEKLQRLDQRDKTTQDHNGSVSSKSVVSRISHMVKGKASRKGSKGNESQSYHEANSSPNGNISPKKSIESDDGSLTRSGRKLIPRLSNFTSPNQPHRRRTTTVDNNMSSSMTPSDWEKTTIRSANGGESPFIINEMGDDMFMRNELDDRGEMTRLCDEKGRCIFHPHIRLQKKKTLFGGWKIIFKHCPDCAVEHMKKTQKELAAQKLKSKRKKHKEQKNKEPKNRKDNFINVADGSVNISEIKVEDVHEKKIQKHKAKKKHSSIEHVSPKADNTDRMQLKTHEHQLDDWEMPQLNPTKLEDNGLADPNQPPTKNSEQYDNDLLYPQQLDTTNSEHLNTPTETEKLKSSYEPLTKSQQNEVDGPDNSLAVVEKNAPKYKKVNGLPWSDYNGQSGRYTGQVNDEYLPHGQGEMVYDRGVVSSGIWYKGVLDTEGPLTQDEYVPERLTSFSVGDRGNPDEHTMIASKKETAAAVALLRVSDAAFVRRSDGNWTYAIVKERTDSSIKFKVNARGSTKSFPMSQWGSYIRKIKPPAVDAPAKKERSLDEFLSNNNRSKVGLSNSVAGGNFISSDHSIGSARSLPMVNRSRNSDNLTTGKMSIRSRSRSRSRNRKNVTTLPLLFSSSMSVSEENEGNDNDGWETASGSGYRLRGIDP